VSEQINRRTVLGMSAALAGVFGVGVPVRARAAESAGKRADVDSVKSRKFKLGLVTYNLAGNFDLSTLIKVCKSGGVEAVEFRTTHKHGVEPSLSKEQREDVKKRFADDGLVIWGLGSTCEFHSPDPAVVTRHIEECKRFVALAHDIGAKGVKVRPNGLPAEVPAEKTLEQIGRAVRTCAQAADDAGVEIWVEVHGRDTSLPPNMRKIMDHADHRAAGVCWNSNGTDVKDGSVEAGFRLLRDKLYSCHINELTSAYPYKELFRLLRETGYDRYTLNECQGMESASPGDVARFLRFYRALWDEMSQPQ
jgi:sugar phosphate isomerase/epimerase